MCINVLFPDIVVNNLPKSFSRTNNRILSGCERALCKDSTSNIGAKLPTISFEIPPNLNKLSLERFKYLKCNKII